MSKITPVNSQETSLYQKLEYDAHVCHIQIFRFSGCEMPHVHICG